MNNTSTKSTQTNTEHQNINWISQTSQNLCEGFAMSTVFQKLPLRLPHKNIVTKVGDYLNPCIGYILFMCRSSSGVLICPYLMWPPFFRKWHQVTELLSNNMVSFGSAPFFKRLQISVNLNILSQTCRFKITKTLSTR